MSDNPLAQYFRVPAIHLPLPSNGKYYPIGTLEMPETGEVPVFPMSAIDEITYKTPDALFNGSAVVDVIKSCIPAISDPWQMPICDLTAVLTAIRIASFGHAMNVTTQCPKCKEFDDYSIDLRVILDAITVPDYTKELKIGDLYITFRPMMYKDLNENNKLKFEEDKLKQLLNDSELEADEQIKLLSASFKKVSMYTMQTVAKNINSIRTEDVTVREEPFLIEFFKNCDNTLYKKIKNTLIDQKTTEGLDPIEIKCAHCEHEYKQPFTLDMSSFFENDS